MSLKINASLGEKIRYYRKKAQLTQKELGEHCGLNESTIRNYELENRVPDWETLITIANVLQISSFALSPPNPSAVLGVLHILFEFENIYGLHPKIKDGKVTLTFDIPENFNEEDFAFDPKTVLMGPVKVWERFYSKYKAGELDEETYLRWQSKYPTFVNMDPDNIEFTDNRKEGRVQVVTYELDPEETKRGRKKKKTFE